MAWLESQAMEPGDICTDSGRLASSAQRATSLLSAHPVHEREIDRRIISCRAQQVTARICRGFWERG
jgi:hypothetical protein